MNRRILIMTSAMVFLACFPTQQTAYGARLQFGDLAVIPGITLVGEYDDNIYLGNGDNNDAEKEQSDYIAHIKPAVALDYKLPARGTLTAGYEGDFAYYDDNDENDWKRHQGTLNLNYLAPSGLILGADNRYVNTEDPYSSENEYRLGVAQVERWDYTLKTKLGWDFSDQFRILGYYNFYKQLYDDDVDFSQDYKSNEVGAGTELRLAPMTWGFIRYHYGERDYLSHPGQYNVTDSNDADHDWHRVNTGVTWDATAKLSGEVNFGYQWRTYDNDADPDGRGYDDKNTWIASTFVAFKASPVATLSSSVTRALRDEGADTNDYFTDTGVGLTLVYVFREKTTFSVGGSYARHDYNEPSNKEREDDNYKAKLGVDYLIQDWISVGAGYQYWEKDSNYSAEGFEDNRAWGKVTLVY